MPVCTCVRGQPRYQLLDCDLHRPLLWPAERKKLEIERRIARAQAGMEPTPNEANGDPAGSSEYPTDTGSTPRDDFDAIDRVIEAGPPELKPCTCPPGKCWKRGDEGRELNPGFECDEERAQAKGADRAADENTGERRENRLSPGDDFTVAGELRVYIGMDDEGVIGTRFRAVDMTDPELIGALKMVAAMVMRQAIGQARDVD